MNIDSIRIDIVPSVEHFRGSDLGDPGYKVLLVEVRNGRDVFHTTVTAIESDMVSRFDSIFDQAKEILREEILKRDKERATRGLK